MTQLLVAFSAASNDHVEEFDRESSVVDTKPKDAQNDTELTADNARILK